MSTTDDQIPFDSIKDYLQRYQETPFAVAARKVEQMSVVEFNCIRGWYELFPIPEFTSTQRLNLTGLGIHTGQGIREQRLIWERDASSFFTQHKEEVAHQISRATYLFRKVLKAWELRLRPIGEDPETIAIEWMKKTHLPLVDFCKMYITNKMLLPFFVEFAEEWEAKHGIIGKFNDKHSSKKSSELPFANFTDKLINGFTEKRLNALLVGMLMKDHAGNTLKFEKYLLHTVIDALIAESYFDKGSRERDFNALARFLGLKEGRIKNGWGDIRKESAAQKRAKNHLKKERKKNSSNSVP